MTAFKTAIDNQDEGFRANSTAMKSLVADLRTQLGTIKQGGGAAARDKHTSRGKLLPRERIRLLLDVGSPFLELSQFAAYGMYSGDIAAAGIITGIGGSTAANAAIAASA